MLINDKPAHATAPEELTAPEAALDNSLNHPFEGDYRPPALTTAPEPRIRIEPLQVEFLHRVADALNTTLDVNTLMHRVADLVRAVIDYRIFAIMLLNDRTNDLRMRFQIGHKPAMERMRVRLGQGVVGQAALQRRSLLIDDVSTFPQYVNANANVRSELAVPLIVKNKVIGVLDLESEQPGFFTHEHQRLLELTASRMSSAIENARLYTRVARQAETLAVLNDISREITSILDLDDLLERIGQLLKRIVDFQMFTILLWNERTEQFEHRFSSRYGERVTRIRTVELGHGLIGTAAQQRVSILAPDVRRDARYVAENPETRSELTVPLLYKGRVIGVLDLEHTRPNYYNEDHQRTLITLAAQIAISIANARLYQRIHEEEQRMERDLEMARQVQLRLLPAAPPRLRNAEIAARFMPARSIGGDVYDFLDYGPGCVALAIGDVSGKAAPAALYAALVSGILRSLAAQHLAPGALLAALNDQLQERKLASQYVTMLIAVWNDAARTLTLANAGSVQPLFIRRENATLTDALGVHTVHVEGFPLGLFPNATYDETTLATQPGDLIVFFSDGIVDAHDAHADLFGSERLCTLLQHHPTASTTAEAAVTAILEAVSLFQAGTEHFDDETVVVLRVR